MNFLIDYNLKGQSALVLGTIAAERWLELIPIRFVGFEDIGFSKTAAIVLFGRLHKAIR